MTLFSFQAYEDYVVDRALPVLTEIGEQLSRFTEPPDDPNFNSDQVLLQKSQVIKHI